MTKEIVNTSIKLDKYDKIILAELDKNCRTPLSCLARKVRRSRQSVEYRINELLKAGVITGFNTSINPSKIGYRVYKIYLQTKNVEQRTRMIKFLHGSGNVYWMGECDGEWDLIFAISARNEKEFFDFKNNFFSKFGDIIIKHHGDTLVEVKQYPKMYFTNQTEKPTMFAGEVVENKIDSVDQKIISYLMTNANMHVNEIARKAGTTAAIVRSRMKKMESMGLIIQYRIGVGIERLGMQSFKSIVHIDKYTEEEEKRFVSFVSMLHNVQYIVRNMWQTEIEFIVKNYNEYNEIINNLKKNFPTFIRNIESVLMKTDEWTPGYRKLVS